MFEATYWSTQERSLTPACILLPTTALHVATAVKALSLAPTCAFAVKSGGHMAHAGAANIQNGVTIDLHGLQQININEPENLVTLGPGVRWGAVYTELGKRRLAVVGARSADVGVGGYLLGGGSSYIMDHGFGCDNVLAYQVVLASGTIQKVTASEHPQLFKALKGGSSNFGIVTSYTIRTFALGDIWGGNIIYPASTVDQQMKAFNAFAASAKYDLRAAVQMSIGFSPAANTVFINQPFYALPQINPPALQPFTSIQPQLQDLTSITGLAAFAALSADQSPRGSRQMTWSISFQNDLSTLHAIYDAFDASTSSISNVTGISWSITLTPLPKAFLQASADRGGNSLGLSTDPQGNAFILCDSSFTWTLEKDTVIVRDAGLKLLKNITKTLKDLRTFNDWVDLNHADFTQDPLSSYGTTNKARLREVSLRYDPMQMFQRQVPGGFKLFPHGYAS